MAISTPYYEENKKRQDRERVIFVEGADDALFITELLEEIGADKEKVGIVDVGGTSNFDSALRGFLRSGNFTQKRTLTIAIVCDADDDPAGITGKIHSVLTAFNLPTPNAGEFVDANADQRIGLFLMPKAGEHGDLEKLCLGTVEGTDLETRAEEYMAVAEQNANAAGANGHMKGSRHKRKAQVYLAGMPGTLCRGVGRAFANGTFDRTHEAITHIRDFLGRTI